MPRLFVGARDIQFINDTVKELVKDVVDQKIYYYAISSMATQVHRIYNEANKKVFEKPVALNVLAGQPTWETKHTKFGGEQKGKVEIIVQARDLLDKKLYLSEGDYFTYGDAAFEVVSYLNVSNIYGQEEYESAYKLVGLSARSGEFDPNQYLLPRKDEPGVSDETQLTFEQQRGLPETTDGRPTGDVRQMRERLGEDMAPPALGEGPRRVVPDESGKASRFSYDS